MRLSINRNIVGKHPEAIGMAHHRGENTELNIEQLAAIIRDDGFAYSAQYDGPRRAANFLACGFAAVDIDGGSTIEQVEADPLFRHCGSLLHTTASHTVGAPRFRIIFMLEQAITDASVMSKLLRGLMVRFRGDPAATDAARLYFGHPGCEVRLYGNTLPADEVAKIIQHGEEKTMAYKARKEAGARSMVRSRLSIPADTRVRTADGTEMLLLAAPEGTRIFCPQHLDTRPSAFVAFTKAGKPCVSCSACDATYFPEGFRPRDDRSYIEDEWEQVLKITPEEYLENYDDANGVSLSVIRGFPITILNERYLPYDDAPPVVGSSVPRSTNPVFDYGGDAIPPGLFVQSDVILIKSAKGTGKTSWLEDQLAAYKAAGVSVVLVSYRRVLLAALSQRLGLTNYLTENNRFHYPTKTYSICLDSLGKLKPSEHRFEVVVIDECEAVFSHLLAATMKAERRTVLTYLRQHIRQARQVILVDADLGKLTLDVIDELTQGQDRTPEVIINQWKPAGAAIGLYDGPFPQQLVGDLVAALQRGERCYVCSNSKGDVDLLTQQLPLYVTGHELKVMSITSDNSHTKECQHFIQNITTEILRYDVVISSPSISTGVDITFPGDVQGIDVVFGIFHPLVLTHLEIDQQLARVRNPKEIRVWISKAEFNFETDPNVIRAEILASEHEHHVLIGTHEDGRDKFLADPVYDTVFSSVTALQRASKNALRRNFIRYKQANNWTITTIAADPARASVGARLLKAGREVRDEAERQQIVAASPIDLSTYLNLREQNRHTPVDAADAYRMRRFEVEAYYREEVSMALLEFDGKGRMRKAIRNLSAVLATESEVQDWDSNEQATAFATDKHQWAYKKEVLGELLRAAGLLDDSGIVTNAQVDAPMLGAFVNAVEAHRASLQRLFDMAPRIDYDTKPVRQLADVLKIVGLKLVKVGRSQVGGRDRTVHGLDPEELEKVLNYVERRKKNPDGVRISAIVDA